MKSTTVFRLPGGRKWTKSADRYIRAWRRLAKPIVKALGGHLIGFDPGLLIGFGNKSQDFPEDVALLLSKALENK